MVNIIPANANNVAGSDKSPIETKVAGLSMTKPAFFKPINAINNPMPHCTPILRAAGIASAILVLTPVRDNIKNKIPFQNTMPKAASHGISRVKQMVKAKKALSPIPGAIAMG